MATTQERTVLNLRGMTITIPADECIYVELGEKTFYIDDSTGESIMEWWPIYRREDLPRPPWTGLR
jgi:hypothetical protein